MLGSRHLTAMGGMSRRGLIAAACVLSLATGAFGLQVGVEQELPSERAIPEARLAPGRSLEALKSDPRFRFRYGTVGLEYTAGVPYWLFLAIPRIFDDEFHGQGFGEHYGFPKDDHEYFDERQELPAGFVLADTTVRLSLLSPPVRIKRVAFNCSTCHRGSYLDASGQPHFVDGMPSTTIDTQGYQRSFQRFFQDPRFTGPRVVREINALLKERNRPPLTSEEVEFYERMVAVIRELSKGPDPHAWMDRRPAQGPGRADAFNFLKFETLGLADDGTCGPADLSSLWNQSRAIRPQHNWDGDTTDAFARNLGAILTVAHEPGKIDKESVHSVGAWTETELKPPRFPFGPIDGALAQKGKAIFVARCGGCHGVYDPQTGQLASGERSMITNVHTDPGRRSVLGPAAAESLSAYGAKHDLWRSDAFHSDGGDGYLAPPLDGIWARAPYLHNGSVPTLYDLLSPPSSRPQKFFRGDRRYDAKKLGFVSNESTSEGRTLFPFDTHLRGNGNGGHSFGDSLREDERWQIIEYLKTL
jgi:mono/diheme cytochrome c family protein